MRAREFIFEAQNYEQMFEKYPRIYQYLDDTIQDNEFIRLIKVSAGADNALSNSLIKSAKQSLRRQDRIVWYLRYVKAHVVRDFIKRISQALFSRQEMLSDNEKQIINDILEKLQREYKMILQKTGSNPEQVYSSFHILDTLAHFVSLDDIIPAAKQTVWKYQSFEELERHYDELESEWRESQADSVKVHEGDKIILEINNKQAWWLLDREACRDEGAAMGHCGNTHRPKPGDRILSFRTMEDNNRLVPRLTFILDRNGYLGEMKGRGNTKPAAKYHPAIIALLNRTDVVKGIKGGGYRPENNFSLDDIEDDAVVDALVNKNPNLLDVASMIERFGINKDVKLRILSDMETMSPYAFVEKGSVKITQDDVDATIIIQEFSSIGDFVEDSNNSAAEYALKVFNGEEIIDFNYRPDKSQVSDLYDEYFRKNPEDLEKIKSWLESKYDYDEEQEDDWLDFAYENDIDEIVRSGEFAVLRGEEVGTESEMYRRFVRAIEDIPYLIIKGEGVHSTSPAYIAVDLDNFISELDLGHYSNSPEDVLEAVTNGILSDTYGEFRNYFGEPHYGWAGFDEDYAIEDLGDELYQNGVITR